MTEEILKIEKIEGNLQRFPEFWQSSTYEAKRAFMENEFLEKKHYPLHQNLKLFREMTFMVKASTTIEKIRRLCDIIHDRYKMECFQIAIDREQCVAHLLWLWVDKELSSIVLTHFDQKKLTVLVLRYLNLPRPKSMKPLIKYFLIDAYDLDHEVFEKQLDVFYHTKVPGMDYSLIADAIKYAEYVCKGELK